MQLRAPRGTQDLLPEQSRRQYFVTQCFRRNAECFGFESIETPAFENKELFVRGVGEGTDIVRKEMYAVKRLSKDKEEEIELVLRPEGTAGVVRAYIEHGLHTIPQPLKLYYIGSFFRYERPQAGRFREFHQCAYKNS